MTFFDENASPFGSPVGWPGIGANPEPQNFQQEYLDQRRREENDRLSKLYLDDAEFARMSNEGPVREARKLSLMGDELPKMAANAAYLSHRTGKQITAQDYQLYRDAYAAQHFGQDNVNDSQFFDLVKGEFDLQSKKQAALRDLTIRMAGQSLKDAVSGIQLPATTVFSQWRAEHPEILDGADDLPYLAAAIQTRDDFAQELGKYAHLAGPGLDLLQKFTSGQAGEDDLRDFATKLGEIPEADREQTVEKVVDLIAMGAEAGQIDRGGLAQFARNLGQTFSRGFNFVPQFAAEQWDLALFDMRDALATGDVWLKGSGEASLYNILRPGNAQFAPGVAIPDVSGRKATPEEIEKLKADVEVALPAAQFVRQLRAVADNYVDPIKRLAKPGSWMGMLEGGVYGVAGSLPYLAATGLNPFLGLAAYQATEYDRIRLENKDMKPRAAMALAGVEGAWQAALDKLQLKTLQGALPVTGRLLGQIKSTGLRRALGFAASGGEQFGQELAQDIGTLAIDAVAAAIREDMPDQDLGAKIADYWKNQAGETFVASMIFGLWGGGAITAKDIKATRAQLDEMARIAGISEEGRKRMQAATTPEELDTVVRRELQNVTPESKAAGALYAKAKRQAAEAAQADPNEPTLEITKDDKGKDVFTLRTPENEVLIQTTDPQAAQAAYLDFRTAADNNEVQALKDVVAYWQTRDPNLSFEQAPALLVKDELDRMQGIGDKAGIERLRQRLVAADINPDGDLTGVQIFGSTSVEEIGENVYRGTIMLRDGASPETVFEEVNHAFVRKALMRGDVTLETLTGWLDQTAAATGLDIKRGNEVEVIESIAQVGMDLFNGRLDRAHLPQSFVDYLRRLMRVIKEIYVRAVKVTEAFDRGEIDGNFEQFLMESMGMSPQQQIDINRETVAKAVATGADYSIGRPRVEQAIDAAFNRKPGERLAMYERAKQMFDRVAARRGPETSASYARTLQSLWELDAILKVLPAEVRGKVGGFTKIAELEPTDLYRGEELVAESNSPAGARISAWMKEGMNIGEAGKQNGLPEGYTTRRATDPARATKATDDFLVKRLATVGKQLDRYLANEYRIAIERTLAAARPKKGDNGVRKSTLGPEAQAYADKAAAAAKLDNDQTAQRMATIEAELLKEETPDDRRIDLVEEWGLLNTFGDIENRNAETLAQGYVELKGRLGAGRAAWRIKEEARIAEQRGLISSIIAGLGEADKVGRFADKSQIKKLAEWLTAAGLDHANFEQLLRGLGFDDTLVIRWSDALRKADTGAQDMELAMRQELLEAVRAAAKSAGMSTTSALALLKRPAKRTVRAIQGYKEAEAKISIELVQKIVNGELAPKTRAENPEAVKDLLAKGKVIMDDASLPPLTKDQINELRETLAALPADTKKKYVSIGYVLSEGRANLVAMSPAQAIQLELSWDQPDVQEKMRREGWTGESIEDIRAITSQPVAAETLAFLRDFYARNYAVVNPVYARMFGMNMPQAKFYAPSRFVSAGKQQDVGLDGSPQVTGSTPAFAKARVNHSSPVAAEDALTVFQQHAVQSAHWVNFAEFAREARAVTSNIEVRESIKQKFGKPTLDSLDAWVEMLEQRGANRSREIKWLSDVLGSALGGTAISALGFNLKTVLVQADSAMRFMLALDPKQIGSALSNPVELAKAMPKVWFSPTVQRRLQGGMNPAAQFLFARLSSKPGVLSNLAWLSMQPIQIFDAAATTISSAIVFRATYNEAKSAGMPDAQAEAVALDAMDAAVYRYSQPTGFGSKSNVENTAGPVTKLFTLFMSDPRLKTGVMLDAVRQISKGKDVGLNLQRLLVIEMMALVSHVIASAYRDAFSDDEDEDIWSIGGFVRALALAPFQGLFLAGTVTEVTLKALVGEKVWVPSRDPFASNFESAIRAAKGWENLVAPEDAAAGLKAWTNALRGIAISTPLGAPAALLNIIRPLVGGQENAQAEE